MPLLQGANGPAAPGHKNCSLSLWGQCHPVILRILAQMRLSWGPQESAGKAQEGECTTSDQRQDVQWRGPTQWEYTVSIYASGSHWSVSSLRCGPGFLKGNLQSTPQEIKRNLLSSKRCFSQGRCRGHLKCRLLEMFHPLEEWAGGAGLCGPASLYCCFPRNCQRQCLFKA